MLNTFEVGRTLLILDLMASESGLADNIVIEDPRRVLQTVPQEVIQGKRMKKRYNSMP
jgi:hypothetical protein